MRTCGHASLDLTVVGMRGPGGVAAGGRMAAVGMVKNPAPEDSAWWSRPKGRTPSLRARYLTSPGGRASPVGPMRKRAARMDLDRSGRRIALSDAGAGLGGRPRVDFGRVEAVILDFYRVTERLGDLDRALYPGDESARKGRLDPLCHRLKHEAGRVVLEELRSPASGGRESVREVQGEVAGYFEDHIHRMDYPS